MALPEETQVCAHVVSFAPAKEPVDETGHRKSSNCLNAKAGADRQFINLLEALSQCRQLEPSEAEIMGALDRALRCVIEATWANDGRLLIMDKSSGDLIFALVHGDAPRDRLLWQRLPAGRGDAHWAASHRRAAIVNNRSNDERLQSGIDVATGFHTRSLVAAPLLEGDKVLGVIQVRNKKNGGFFSPSDRNHVTVMAHLFSAILIQLRESQAEKLVQR